VWVYTADQLSPEEDSDNIIMQENAQGKTARRNHVKQRSTSK